MESKILCFGTTPDPLLLAQRARDLVSDGFPITACCSDAKNLNCGYYMPSPVHSFRLCGRLLLPLSKARGPRVLIHASLPDSAAPATRPRGPNTLRSSGSRRCPRSRGVRYRQGPVCPPDDRPPTLSLLPAPSLPPPKKRSCKGPAMTGREPGGRGLVPDGERTGSSPSMILIAVSLSPSPSLSL